MYISDDSRVPPLDIVYGFIDSDDGSAAAKLGRRLDWRAGERDIRCAFTLVRCGKSISIYRLISGLSLLDYNQLFIHPIFQYNRSDTPSTSKTSYHFPLLSSLSAYHLSPRIDRLGDQ